MYISCLDVYIFVRIPYRPWFMIGALILEGLKCEEGGISEKCNHKHTLEACAPTYFTLVMMCILCVCVCVCFPCFTNFLIFVFVLLWHGQTIILVLMTQILIMGPIDADYAFGLWSCHSMMLDLHCL